MPGKRGKKTNISPPTLTACLQQGRDLTPEPRVLHTAMMLLGCSCLALPLSCRAPGEFLPCAFPYLPLELTQTSAVHITGQRAARLVGA